MITILIYIAGPRWPVPESLSMPLRRLPDLLLLLLALFLALPVLALLASWLPVGQGAGQGTAVLAEMARTVLPGYAGTTLALCAMVALGVI